MLTFKWFVRLFFWLFITMKELSPKNDLAPDYAMKVCLFSTFGTTPIIAGVVTTLGFDLGMGQSLALVATCFFAYLVIGAIFFFSEPNSNSNPVWQNNGPW